MEMAVFRLFAPASGLPIDEGSPENHDPKPDILCTISGQKYFFELGRIINKVVAEKLSVGRRALDAGFSYDQESPLLEIIQKKATTPYETNGAPLDLILHFDLRLGSAAVVERLVRKDPTILDSLTTTGPFKRVWIFDEYTKTIVTPRS